MSHRSMIYRPEYVKENNVVCEKCQRPAHATHYDGEWEAHDYCEECLPKLTVGWSLRRKNK